jgi:hypothetical protein
MIKDKKGTSDCLKRPPERHCEEQSDEAIQLKDHELLSGLLRFARNDDYSHSLTSPFVLLSQTVTKEYA